MACTVGIVEELTEDLNCSICQEPFVQPKVLQCRHAFCRKCLEQWINTKRNSYKVSCPECRAETPLRRGGIADLPEPLVLRQMQEKISRYLESQKWQTAERRCEMCKNANCKANAFCPACAVYLCGKCLEQHGENKVTRRHSLVMMSKQTMCAAHQGELIMFSCQSCRQGVCAHCLYEEHGSHDIIEINDDTLQGEISVMYRECQERLTNRTELLRQHKETTDKSVCELQSAHNDATSWEKELVNQITTTVSDLATKRAEQVQSELKVVHLSSCDVQYMTATHENLLTFVDGLLTRNNPHELALSVNELPGEMGCIPAIPNVTVQPDTYKRGVLETVRSIVYEAEVKLPPADPVPCAEGTGGGGGLAAPCGEVAAGDACTASVGAPAQCQSSVGDGAAAACPSTPGPSCGAVPHPCPVAHTCTVPPDPLFELSVRHRVEFVIADPRPSAPGWWIRTRRHICKCDPAGNLLHQVGYKAINYYGGICVDTSRDLVLTVDSRRELLCFPASPSPATADAPLTAASVAPVAPVRVLPVAGMEKSEQLFDVAYCAREDRYIVHSRKRSQYSLYSELRFIDAKTGAVHTPTDHSAVPSCPVVHHHAAGDGCRVAIYDCSFAEKKIAVYSCAGEFSYKLSMTISLYGRIVRPLGFCMDAEGRVLLADRQQGQILRITFAERKFRSVEVLLLREDMEGLVPEDVALSPGGDTLLVGFRDTAVVRAFSVGSLNPKIP